MFHELYKRYWVRPQLTVMAWINSIDTHPDNWECPKSVLNKKGALAVLAIIADGILCEIAFHILGISDKVKFEDTKRHEQLSKYLEDKGIIDISLTSADKYHYYKKFLNGARLYLKNHDLRREERAATERAIRQVEPKMKQMYEEALILQLAEVEKG